MSKCITAFMFILGGIGCLKAVECYLQHQWVGWEWLTDALLFICAGMWRLEKL